VVLGPACLAQGCRPCHLHVPRRSVSTPCIALMPSILVGGGGAPTWWYSSTTAHRSVLRICATQAIRGTGAQGCTVHSVARLLHCAGGPPANQHTHGVVRGGCRAHQLVIRDMIAPSPTPCC
jgi:hypothetical protein